MTETGVLTLSDFLLARIAEDEAWISGDGGELEDCQECAFGQQPQSPYSRARVLAECEAKRGIVEGMRLFGPIDDINAPEVLGLLALPYADHPDYRQEWRPY